MRLRKFKPPTDRQILACMYNEYYEEFASFTKDNRVTKMFVPINFDLIGEKLGVDGDIPFGVLYYYLNPKYELLEKEIGPDDRRNINAVHFPILAAVLAELNDEHRKHRTQVTIGWVALIIAALSLLASILVKNTIRIV